MHCPKPWPVLQNGWFDGQSASLLHWTQLWLLQYGLPVDAQSVSLSHWTHLSFASCDWLQSQVEPPH